MLKLLIKQQTCAIITLYCFTEAPWFNLFFNPQETQILNDEGSKTNLIFPTKPLQIGKLLSMKNKSLHLNKSITL